MNKLYGLYFLPAPGDGSAEMTRFVSASHAIDKLMQTLPHVEMWTTSTDPNSKNLRRYAELPDNSKYIIYEIPFIC